MTEISIFIAMGILCALSRLCNSCYYEEEVKYETIQDKTCSICLEELSSVKFITKTKCNHYFCSTCILDWLQVKKVCPMCMTEL